MPGKEIVIDKSRCDGCGLCVQACHEGALAIVDGKAEMVRRDFCDGIGDCLPACPQGAIRFVDPSPGIGIIQPNGPAMGSMPGVQWPIQMALVPVRSDLFRGDVVIAADCTAFVMEGFKGFLDGRPVIIGCPKLDDRSRFDKVSSILNGNPIDKVTVVRMEVPCCRALSEIVCSAAKSCDRDVTVEEIVISRDGSVIG